MSQIEVLDCTLRDGGYVNDFRFGSQRIEWIIQRLVESNVDVVECGFLEEGEYDKETTIFSHIGQIRSFLPKQRSKTIFVAMCCYGEFDETSIPAYDGTSIDGIRISFHYNEVDSAMQCCKRIKDKGYKVFVQPVGTTSYSDEELLSLIRQVNEIQPYAFYFVDTLGLMHSNDVLRFYYLVDHNLSSSIRLGFHSHNNLQLSYSNSLTLIGQSKYKRTIMLDSSVYGMGRGAGNLNTEIIVRYLNDHFSGNYRLEPLLEIIDECLIKIKQEFGWGYSISYYLAAISGCHPSYATHLTTKQTLTIEDISKILKLIPNDSRTLFDKSLIDRIYMEYQDSKINDTGVCGLLKKRIKGENVLVIAPGASLNQKKDFLKELISGGDYISIAVAFVPDFINVDYVFISNKKRYKTLKIPQHQSIIHTSNIQIEEDNAFAVNYSSLLNEDETIMDNSVLMLLYLLVSLCPKVVSIVGFDGYTVGKNNYYDKGMSANHDDIERLHSMNVAISKRVKELRSNLNLKFLTSSLYNDAL